ncbi:MAG: DNA-protecting protein DprA, partial [Bacteroidetes bacterium]|nr:DNA-protecting protein DprA [Bacteroidota bacterium]
MQNELRYQVALSMVPGIGPVHAKLLVEKLGNASCIFNSRKHLLERIEGIGTVRAAAVCGFDNWQAVEEEMTFMQR